MNVAPQPPDRLETTARPTSGSLHPWVLYGWCIIAAFGAYACMYGFRKPFTSGTFIDPTTGLSSKTWLVTAQILGYTLSKFIGIRVIAEMRAERRAWVLLGLIAAAELALLLFAVTPPPFNAVCLFFNGLPLGMVFGLVLGFLEGRRQTEAFVAGLCASFILADGFTKSVGASLLKAGVPEPWMPFAAGLVFTPPLLGFVWMLRRIPPPSLADVESRSAREPMRHSDRTSFLKKHGIGVGLITLVYLLVTLLRSFRADYAPELWTALGERIQPAVFTRSEIWVALGVIVLNGAVAVIRNNRRAFFCAIALSAAGLILAASSVVGLQAQSLSGFPFMVLLGLGVYIPYVAVHTTLFERLIAITRDRGNLGFLMYLADAFGYLAYVGVMIARQKWGSPSQVLGFFSTLTLAVCLVSILAILGASLFFRNYGSRTPSPAP